MDVDVNQQVAVHSMAKRVIENHADDLKRLRREIDHQIYLVSGLCGAAVLIMGLMTWWGLSGAQGPGWQTNWIWGAAIFIGLITLFVSIASANIRREFNDRLASLDRQIQAQEDLIPKYK